MTLEEEQDVGERGRWNRDTQKEIDARESRRYRRKKNTRKEGVH